MTQVRFIWSNTWVPVLSQSSRFMATQMSSAGSATSSVGLLKAHSPWLRKDGVYLGVFLQNSVSG